jgi:predicted metalloprotease
MRWRGRRRSSNIEDRRGAGPSLGRGGGSSLVGLLPLLLRLGGRKGGIWIILILGALFYFTGGNLGGLLGGLDGMQGAAERDPTARVQAGGAQDGLSEFVSVVLADTEDTWHQIFQQELGRRYKEPGLVLYTGLTRSACGMGQAAMGPFYCPADQKVYIDLSFYQDLRTRFKAPGDFAQAYVIAHEVGHHIQTLLGISKKVRAAQQGLSKTEANELSVRQELQADCLAGVWANHAHRTKNILEQGDVEEALGAASAIGDDRMQRRSQGYVTPDSFTHGSSEQRVMWFRKGLEEGRLDSCDTFSGPI